MARQWPGATRRGLEQARRLYARAVVEHERVRRTKTRSVQPSAPLWKPLHDLAFFHGMARRREPLTGFCADFPDAQTVPRAVPTAAYRAALRVAVDLAADQLVRRGGGTPWGRGRPRVPGSREDFEALCRALRDADPSGAVAHILDEADLRKPPAPARAPRIVFDAAASVLVLGDVTIPLPEGQEYDLLRTLASRRDENRITPLDEPGVRWKNAVDQLRRRIRKATGRNLLGAVVLRATAPVGGYRLAPGVEVTGTRQVHEQRLDFADLDDLGPASRRKPRGRHLRGEDDDDEYPRP
jgi:hypothetical protein